MAKTRVMIIDEQAFFRAGVRQALSQQEDLEITECDPNHDTMAIIEANLPDITLLGSDLATHSGLELGRKIARNFPNTKVIILSPDPNDEELFEVIRSAAVACLKKNSSAMELVETIRRASRGEYPINESVMTRPMVAKHVLNQFQGLASLGSNAETIVALLTRRETQILNYVADGNTNKQIARILNISEQTIKNHVSAILRKLNANDRAHAVVLAIRHGWISIGEGQ
ncbi:MAG: response regulator transcription factor [Dehalococcoidales bacterium]|nr:response regulator transcription factor [Dehalococcoidales bacterium]